MHKGLVYFTTTCCQMSKCQVSGGNNLLVVGYSSPAYRLDPYQFGLMMFRRVCNGSIFGVFFLFRISCDCLSVIFLGMTRLRFKPAYNPYTEPSMEVFSYHEG